MRIAYLCSDVDITLSGQEGCSIHVREFTNALVEAGHDVFILCAAVGDRAALTAKARVLELDPASWGARAADRVLVEPAVQDGHLDRDLRSVLYNFRLVADGSSILERERPDFIYERYALFGYAGLELSRRHDLPLILELNAPLCDQQEGYEKFVLTRTAAQVEADAVGRADGIVALTGWLRDWAVGKGAAPDRVRVIPDAVSGRLFAGEPSGDPVRQRYGLAGRPVVGFVGSFHGWHDVRGLLRAFASLHRDDPAVRLLLVGHGGERPALEQAVRQMGLSHAVVFAGGVPHESVPGFIAAMDVCVVPYRPIRDFFFSPLKLFEYMAGGRPTVAAALGQITEVVRDGENGWLYPPGDDAKLAAALAAVLRDPVAASRVAAAARKMVLAEHTWEAVGRQVVAMADELIRHRRSGPCRVEADRRGSRAGRT